MAVLLTAFVVGLHVGRDDDSHRVGALDAGAADSIDAFETAVEPSARTPVLSEPMVKQTTGPSEHPDLISTGTASTRDGVVPIEPVGHHRHRPRRPPSPPRS